MGDIFSLADRAIVWLGPGDSSIRLALSTLGHLGSRVAMTKSPSFLVLHPDYAASEMELGWEDTYVNLPFTRQPGELLDTCAGGHGSDECGSCRRYSW
jgi:hypothetical protein